jgi:hypothetical protein
MARARPLTKTQWLLVERRIADHILELSEEIGEIQDDLENGVIHRDRKEHWQRIAIELGHQLEAHRALLAKVQERVR